MVTSAENLRLEDRFEDADHLRETVSERIEGSTDALSTFEHYFRHHAILYLDFGVRPRIGDVEYGPCRAGLQEELDEQVLMRDLAVDGFQISEFRFSRAERGGQQRSVLVGIGQRSENLEWVGGSQPHRIGAHCNYVIELLHPGNVVRLEPLDLRDMGRVEVCEPGALEPVLTRGDGELRLPRWRTPGTDPIKVPRRELPDQIIEPFRVRRSLRAVNIPARAGIT